MADRVYRDRPSAMLILTARKFVELYSEDARREVVRKVKEIQAKISSRHAVDYLIRQIGFEMSPDYNEDYFAEALNFHLGVLEAYSNRPGPMADYIRLSRTMPGPDDDCLYSDHTAISTATRRHQLDGVARGMPPILMACMPRSASGTLTHSLAHLLDVPVLHTSIGAFPDYFLAPSWIDALIQGGAVTQDHIMANDFNCAALKAAGFRDVFVTVRDPRAAARSQVHWLWRGEDGAPPSLERRIREECIDHFIPWLQSWIDCAHDSASPFRIHMINFKDIVQDLTGTVRRIARILQGDFPAMAAHCEIDAVKEIRVHFNQGDENAWRAEVDEATATALWEACSLEIRELLQLTP